MGRLASTPFAPSVHVLIKSNPVFRMSTIRDVLNRRYKYRGRCVFLLDSLQPTRWRRGGNTPLQPAHSTSNFITLSISPIAMGLIEGDSEEVILACFAPPDFESLNSISLLIFRNSDDYLFCLFSDQHFRQSCGPLISNI